jgi:hypothetical protein
VQAPSADQCFGHYDVGLDDLAKQGRIGFGRGIANVKSSSRRKTSKSVSEGLSSTAAGAQRFIEFGDFDAHRQSFQKFLNRCGLSSV